MDNVKHAEGWAAAWIVIGVYIAIGFVLAVVLPDPVVADAWIPFDTRLARSLAAASADPHRVRLYWAWMPMLLPCALAALAATAPVRLNSRAADKEGSILILVIGFLLFGYVGTPGVVYFVLSMDVTSASALHRMDRMILGMSRGRLGLFWGGSWLTTATLMLAWLSYVAIPVSYFKLLKLHRDNRA